MKTRNYHLRNKSHLTQVTCFGSDRKNESCNHKAKKKVRSFTTVHPTDMNLRSLNLKQVTRYSQTDKVCAAQKRDVKAKHV